MNCTLGGAYVDILSDEEEAQMETVGGNPIKKMDDLIWHIDQAKMLRWINTKEAASADNYDKVVDGKTIRQILQDHGMNRRIKTGNPDYWIDKVREQIKNSPYMSYDLLIIDDLRFVNEAEALRNMGFLIYEGQKRSNNGNICYNTKILESNFKLITPEKRKTIDVRKSKKMVRLLNNNHNNISLLSNHKYYSNLRYMKQKQPKVVWNKLADELNLDYDKNEYVVKITHIQDSYNYVYDIEVENTHSYLLNGVVSHNTINIPEDYFIEDMSDIWLEYLPFLKGTTFYRENTRGYVDEDGNVQEPPLVALTLEEAKKKFEEMKDDVVESADEQKCKNGKCDL